ncbi:MAG: EAL domain-containing protein [Lachnospiraceae bacterium]|nr:EAL domain-containing protein [Lachnospiraceae bacterium]
MLIILTVFAAVTAGLLITYGFLALKKGERKGHMLSAAFFLCGLIYVLLAVALFVPSHLIGALYSVGLGILGWVLYFLTLFVEEMCENPMSRTRLRLFQIIIIIDSAIYITNPFNGFAVKFDPFDFYGVTLCRAHIGPVFFIHGIICYVALFYMIVLLAKRMMAFSVYYRARYVIGMLAVCAVIVSSTLASKYTTSGITDMSLLFLVILLAAVFHLEYSFAPKSLRLRIHRFVSDNIADGVMIYDYKGRLISVNRLSEEIIENDTAKKVNSVKDFLGWPEPDQFFTQTIGTRLFSIVYKQIFDEKSIFVADIFIFHDITDVEMRIDREQKISRTDSLTHAFNRKGFFEAANEFLYENESEAGFALMICGILNFKSINSCYGSRVGDNALRTIERRFRDHHHSYPMLHGRTAEGKFALLVPFDYVDELASDMSYVRVPVDMDVSVRVDLYYGFVVLSDVTKPLDFYYERALMALNECKRRNAVGALEYSFEMEEKVLRQQELTAEMHNAIKDGQFFVELQPQIELETRKVVGAEALARWRHPRLGRIMPGEFIPLFEDNGFILNLDIHIWELAAKTLKQLSDEGGYDGPVSVNVSQVDIRDMDIVSVFERIVEETGISKDKLHIEITESALADRRDLLIYTMEKLKESGFVLEIDDFGSGYSSLNALMHLPFDVVKLDMEFMKNSNLGGKNGIILNSISEMIHALGAEIIVEGVETETNVENMVRFGGDVAQGYYFSRPLSTEAFKEYVSDHR